MPGILPGAVAPEQKPALLPAPEDLKRQGAGDPPGRGGGLEQIAVRTPAREIVGYIGRLFRRRGLAVTPWFYEPGHARREAVTVASSPLGSMVITDPAQNSRFGAPQPGLNGRLP
jgi:hypothetical protein